ncbi:MAG: PEP-CTERM sorting domain-containing protein [Akkermansiaceae bacterium]|nr:PEP-CTERM sorting domain-containing protein [Akkermansiaceae bacterium]
MQLRLPLPLRRCLLASLSLSCGLLTAGTAGAATLHADVSLLTYTDFGQNKGRYVTGNTNALLDYLNADGVTITYTGGQDDYTLEHGMIDFSSQCDGGYAAAIGYNFLATVQHNGVLNPTFTANTLGSSYCIKYYGIEYRYADEYLLTPSNDYKITRLSKLVTDVTPSTVYGSADGDYSAIEDGSLAGQLIYRAGSGTMYKYNEDGTSSYLTGAYTYITGGIDTIEGVHFYNAADGAFSTFTYFNSSSSGVSDYAPLPFCIQSGDSGSPAWVWNENTGQYEYLNAGQSGGGTMSQNRGDCEWTVETMASFDVAADMSKTTDNTIYLNAVTTEGETVYDSTAGAGGTTWSGTATDSAGNVLASYNGVQSGINLWSDLSGLKDTDNWYNYGNAYLNAAQYSSSGKELTYGDIFYNSNLVFTSASSAEIQYVCLNATVDLGIGYVQFSLGDGQETAEFHITSNGTDESGNAYQLNSAGYVIDAGVSVHIENTNTSGYLWEWRKVGEGDLYIEGEGDNYALLNLGGSGTTHLNQDGGYAAYNVLVNNGAAVVISDIGQIRRDLTFGYYGGTLDMNGCSMTWNNDNEADEDGFTIHALDEGAIITNTGETAVTLTWTQSGEQTYLGSFTDTEAGALIFAYDGGEGSTLTLRSIYTDLTHNEGSGMTVMSGSVALEGTNTVHAMGSLNGKSTARYTSTLDWHYADAAMDVTVQSGGTFELGSHARLTGDITVESGGVFLMREGVQHQYEYIEGGYTLEDTDAISAYFGLKGNVNVAEGGSMQITFSEGTTSTLVYAGDITGAGSLTVDLGTDGAALRLTGEGSTLSGEKQLISGGLWASNNGALGDTTTHQWVIGEKAWLASEGFTSELTAAGILAFIDASSAGVLALTSDIAEQFDLSGHTGLIIGAAAGCTVQYGTADTDETLTAINGQWVLGGGGGELVVNFRLTGENDLVLGNAYGSGIVHLTNTANDFTGSIIFAGGVTLSYEEGALGGASVDLSYTNRLLLTSASLGNVGEDAQGAVLADNLGGAALDLSSHAELFVGSSGDAVYSGTITLAEGASYLFGGASGTLTVTSALEAGRGLVVDGQTYSGGAIVLENSASLTGDVAIMGYDAEKTEETSGDITLRLSADNALANAASITVKDGGTLDMAGYDQTLRNAVLESGGAITDSSAGGTSTLTLTADSGKTVSLAGILEASAVIMECDSLTLGGDNTYSTFTVTTGTLTIASGTGTYSGGTLVMNAGTTLAAGGYTANGTIVLGEGASITGFAGIAGNVQAEGAALVTGTSGSITGTILAAEGSSLTMTGFTGALTLNTLSGSGDISVETSYTATAAVSVSGTNDDADEGWSGHLTITGTGSVSSGGTSVSGVKFSTYASFGTGTVTLNNAAFYIDTANSAATAAAATIDIGEGGAMLNGSSGSSYYFTGLSGSGTLYSYLRNGAAAWFAGDLTGFTGTLDTNRAKESTTAAFTFGFGGDSVSYHDITGSGSADAIALFGEGATLASTAASGSSALTPVVYQFQYTDDVIMNATATGQASVTQSGTGTLILSQDNTAAGTLTIDAGGTVQLGDGGETGSWAGSLAGSGTLVNKNTSDAGVTFSDADSFAGSLSLMQGTTLTLGADASGSYTLGEGLTLTVLAADGTAAGAALNAGLVLDGGTISFSGAALIDADTASLTLSGGISAGTSWTAQTISFYDTTTLTEGTYLLASGDWSSFDDTDFTGEGIDSCYTAVFSAGEDGLSMTLTLIDGNFIWAGTEDMYVWNSEAFGSETSILPTAADAVYFTDSAEKKDVSVTAEISAGELIFNAKENYTVTAGEEASLTAGSIRLLNSGTVTLGGGVLISGEAEIGSGAELKITDFTALAGTVTGEGTLTIDTGTESGAISGTISGLNTLQITSGRYEVTSALDAESVVVTGGQYYIYSGTQSSDIVLSGSGWDGETNEYAAAALRVEGGVTLSGDISMGAGTIIAVTGTAGGTFTGAVTLSGDAAMNVVTTATLSGSLNTGGYTLTKTGSGTLTLSTSSLTGSLNVQEGSVTLASWSRSSGLTDLTLGEGTSLLLSIYSSLTAEAIHMADGSSISLRNGNGSGGHTLSAAIDFTGSVSINGSNFGASTVVSGSISGGGTLTLGTTNTNTWTLSSTLSDAEDGSMALTSKSYVILSGANTYTGGTTITANTLTTQNARALGSGGVTITGGILKLGASLNIASLDGTGGTANLNGNALIIETAAGTDASYAGTVSGSGYLCKGGEGSQTFTGSVSAAGLSVQDGTLALTGSTTIAGAVNVGYVDEENSIDQTASLSLAGSTSVAGSFTVDAGSALSLSGTLSLTETIANSGTVTVGSGLTLALDTSSSLYDEAARTFTIISGGAISYDDADTVSFTLSGISSADLTEGSYTVTCGADTLTIAVDIQRDLVWNGGNGTWDTGTTENWLNSGAETVFYALDNVTFGDTEDTLSVALSSEAYASSLRVSGGSYAFSGSAIRTLESLSVDSGAAASFAQALSAGADLNIAGTAAFSAAVTAGGGLNIADGGEAAFEASVSIAGDAVIAGSAAFSGTATITGSTVISGSAAFSAVEQFAGSVTLEEGGVLSLNGTTTSVSSTRSSFTGGLALAGDATLETGGSTTVLVSCALNGSGNTLTKTGGGLLWLDSSASAFSLADISFTVEEGTLRLGGTRNKALPAGAASIEVRNGAELSLLGSANTLSTTLSLWGGSTLDLVATSTTSGVAYTFTGDVTLTASDEDHAQAVIASAKNLSRTLTLSGQITGTGGLLAADDYTAALALNLTHENNTFAGGITITRQNVTLTLAGAGSAGTGEIALNHSTAVMNIAGGDDFDELANIISGNGTVNLTSGALLLSGDNEDFTGAITAADGALLKLAGAAAAGSGSVTLSGTGSELIYAGGGEEETLASAISGEGSVTVEAGSLELDAAQNYTGATSVREGARLRISAAMTASSRYAVESGGELAISAGGSIAAGSAVSIAAASTAGAASYSARAAVSASVSEDATLDGVTVTETALTSTDSDTQGTVTNAAVTVDAETYTIENAAFVNSTITATADGATIILSDVTFDAASSAGGTGSGVTLELDNALIAVAADAASETKDGSAYGTAWTGQTVRVYTLSTFSNALLTGNMTLDLSALDTAELTDGGETVYAAFDFSSSGVTMNESSALEAYALLNGETIAGTTVAGSSTVIFTITLAAVPEPSSAALALLGLGALALRRRRA